MDSASAATRKSAAAAWDQRTLADPHAQNDKAARVEAMFDSIAPTYELVNRVTSLGQDAAWRRRAVALAQVRPGDVVLDVCCGTGDMLRAFAAANPAPKQLVGVDFSGQMLAAGRYEQLLAPFQLCRADGLRLPLKNESVDIVTCAFGVRNFQNLDSGLREKHRILRSDGRCVILEFAPPENAFVRFGYRFYTERILPLVGSLLSRDRSGAYRYLPRSIHTFETRGGMEARLRDIGFVNVSSTSLNLGTVQIYRGYKR